MENIYKKASEVVKRYIFLILACFLSFYGNAQFDEFTHDISDLNGNIDLKKLVSLIPSNKGKNIFIISENEHRHKTVDSLRFVIAEELNKKIGLDYCFFEWSLPDYFIINLLEHKKLQVDSVLRYESEVFKADFYSYDTAILNRDLDFFRQNPVNMIKKKMAILPIDIGTGQQQFTISALGYLTSLANSSNNKFVKRFADSLMFDHQQLFNGDFIFNVADTSFDSFAPRTEEFLKQLSELKADPLLINSWKNLFGEFFHKYYQKNDAAILKRKVSFKNLGRYQNFRDSFMFDNLETELNKKQSWKNILVSVSSIHSMHDYTGRQEFDSVIAKEYQTVGERIQRKYGDTVIRIAMVCYKCKREKEGERKRRKNKNLENYLEGSLASKYEYCYVSLSDMRKNDNFKGFKFYFFPTSDSPKYSDWQNIFDGVIFVRDCQCTQ